MKEEACVKKNSDLRIQKNYDRKTKQKSFETGDWVLVFLMTDANKLLMQWKGPLMAGNKVSSNNSLLKVGNKFKTFYTNLLQKYHQRENHSLSPSVYKLYDTDEPDEILVEFAPIKRKKTVADVQYRDQLTRQQKQGFSEMK